MNGDYSEISQALIEQGFVTQSGVLSDAAYAQVATSVPIICVDLIPVRKQNDAFSLGAIVRATGKEAGKLALIGGRVRYGEALLDALRRHAHDALGVEEFEFLPQNSIEQPFYVAQYAHQPSATGLFDPSKYSIGLTYLVKFRDEDFKPGGEASAFEWLNIRSIPEDMAFNQQIVYKSAVENILRS